MKTEIDYANHAQTPSVLARLAGLKTMSTATLKDQWRELFGKEPPPFNRSFLQSRLGYRIQELSYGGLTEETRARLAKLAQELEDGRGKGRGGKACSDTRPVRGTKLIRQWKAVDHVVEVTDGGFEYDGRPYKSLSPIERAITGTRWNGPLFFGLRNARTVR